MPFKKFLFSFLTIAFAATSAPAQTMDYFDLGDYKWKNRLVLIFSPNTYNPAYRSQIREFKNSKKGVKERDLKIFQVLRQSSAAAKGNIVPDDAEQKLRDKFGVSPSDFALILIGKDGTEKFRSGGEVSADEIFSTIDEMPMRRLEMSRGDG